MLRHDLISRKSAITDYFSPRRGALPSEPLEAGLCSDVSSCPQADIILWDYKKRELIARLSLHKGKIEALAFSPNDLYLVSLGGPDDGR